MFRSVQFIKRKKKASCDSRVLDLALNQAAKPWKPISISIGTICGGLFPKMLRGQATLDSQLLFLGEEDVGFYGKYEMYHT